MKKRGSLEGLLISILILLIFVAAYLLYINYEELYEDYKKSNTPLNFSLKVLGNNAFSYNGDLQFYPNMRFINRNISYSISDDCDAEKKLRMIRAFNYLQEQVGLINFYPSNNPDIIVSCQNLEIPIQGDYFIAGEGGPTKIINTSKFYLIEGGKILLLYQENKCENFNIELHELLHVFGFKHSPNKKSVMYNFTECNQVMTSDIISELRRLYSIPELPDFYFVKADASKKGVYLDFKIEVRNAGLKSENATLLLYSEGEKIKEFDLGLVGYGEGKILDVKNVRLKSRKTREIEFIIKNGKELDIENNKIILSS